MLYFNQKKMFLGKERLDGTVVSVYTDVRGHRDCSFRFMNSRVYTDLPWGWSWPTDDLIRIAKRDFVEFMSSCCCEKCGKKLDITTGRYDVRTDMIVCKDEKACKERRMNNETTDVTN